MTKQTTPLQAPAAETLNFALADLILSDLNPRQEADPEGIAARAAAKLLQHEIKVYVGSSVEIELKGEGGIERSVGKAKRVVDLRKK